MSNEATIRRGVRNARYAVVPNHVFEDSRLSMEARWLLGYLLSKPDNWTVVIGDIVKKGNCGRDKARKMIAELVEYGYAEREQEREGGKFGASSLVIFDEPREMAEAGNAPVSEGSGESVAFLPQTEMPSPVKPAPVSPSPVKSAPSNNLSSENTDSQQAQGESACEDEEARAGSGSASGQGLNRMDRKKAERAFTLWYATWDKGDIGYARNAWFALSPDERAECIEKTPAYIAWAGRNSLTAAAVYLKHRAWNDMPEHVASSSGKTRGIAKVGGKLWMGTRFAALLSEPTGRFVITDFDETRIAEGRISREELLREKRRDHGWPLVNRMRDLSRTGQPFVCSLALLPLVEDFQRVSPDGDLFAAWQRLHERRGWPFIDRHGEHVYFPPIDAAIGDLDAAVEAAITNFERRLNEGRADDAA